MAGDAVGVPACWAHRVACVHHGHRGEVAWVEDSSFLGRDVALEPFHDTAP